MEGVLSMNDKQNLVSSFLEIAVGQTPETALQFLQITSWKLEEAIQLFYVGNEMGGAITEQLPSSSTCGGNAIKANEPTAGESRKDGGKETAGQNVGDGVRAPLPVKREVLYDDVMLYPLGSRGANPSHEPVSFAALRDFVEEMKRPAVWESEQGATSTAENPRNNLASLYRPPFHLMFQGSFEKAKALASMEDKWLLVNLQSTKEFSSHMLNRDTWANEAVSQTISTNFIFWQVYDDTSKGQKICTYYRLDSNPVVLVIDPITGEKMKSWGGMIQPESLLENLVPFMDGGPKDHHLTLSHKRPQERSLTPQNFRDVNKEEDKEMQEALAASLEAMKEDANDDDDAIKEEEEPPYSSSTNPPKFPPLPEEPKEEDRSLLCRVGVRLPNGSRVQRNFFLTDPIQLLWSFCNSQLGDGEGRELFQLTQAIPGASRRSLDYDSNLTFEESGLANSMISITWE